MTIRCGHHQQFDWLVAPTRPPAIAELVTRCHPSHHLGIACFDSGQIVPTEEERVLGWTVSGKVMISPPLVNGVEIPYAESDEWYLLEQPRVSIAEPELFVTYFGFTVEPVDEINKWRDPTWDRQGMEWLRPLQDVFWQQIKAVNPVSYLAMGACVIVVSRCRKFIEQVRSAVGWR